jgi:OPA family glycerol-3-phosphate transporter-like MFS transporter
MPTWLRELVPILILLVTVAVVVARLPRSGIEHQRAFLRRRVQNWLPVGLTYAFLYMGRYNLNATIGPLFEKDQFSTIYGFGTLAYGFSFLLNGPLADRFGGKATILAAAVGAALVRASARCRS